MINWTQGFESHFVIPSFLAVSGSGRAKKKRASDAGSPSSGSSVFGADKVLSQVFTTLKLQTRAGVAEQEEGGVKEGNPLVFGVKMSSECLSPTFYC